MIQALPRQDATDLMNSRTKRAPAPPRQPHDYWRKRIRSAQFRRGLRRAVGAELRDLAPRRVADLVDATAVRRALRQLELGRIDREVLGDFLIAMERHFTLRLRRDRRSLFAVLGPELAPDVEALLAADGHLPPFADDLVAGMLDQELVNKLLTDLVFTAIGAFNRRVNPIFGAVTTHMLEDQIKGFIRLFMPTLQRQAVAFATSRTNQRLLVEFSRAFVRQLFEQPVAAYADLPSPTQRRRAEALLRKALRTKKADAALRQAALDAWDNLYRNVAQRTVAELIDVTRYAEALTDLAVTSLQRLLDRDELASFLAAELHRAPRT